MNNLKRTKTKIVATLGPATSTYEKVKELVLAGATMFRMNTSHETMEIHAERIKTIKKVAKDLKKFIPIMIDLQGPKIRVGTLTEPIELVRDKEYLIEYSLEQKDNETIPVDYSGIVNDVKIGDKILLDDGKIELKVTTVMKDKIKAKVVHANLLKSRKGLNLPGATGSLASVTDRDEEFIKFAVEQEADYVALSFVRESCDVILAKKYIQKFGGRIPIIAKIEKPQALDNLSSIMQESDGVMVARGDLGIEMSPEEVPLAQKVIIEEAIKTRKLCIVATQMLESMIENPIPTRAEASDVANAILDGTDAVMLSGETAMGEYPVEAVAMMSMIADNIEDSNFSLTNLDLEINDNYEITPQAIANAAVQMADDLNAKAILTFTHTGYTPRLLSKVKPTVPIIAISDEESTCRRLSMYWGIQPIQRDWDSVVDKDLLDKIDNLLYENTDFKKDERIIIIGSIPDLITGRTNFMRVHRIGA